MTGVLSYEELQAENQQLRRQLDDATDLIQAIQTGQIDALVVEGSAGHELYTLTSADQNYRIFIESMNEGALTVGQDGLILYCNSMFATMVGRPLSQVIGTPLRQFVAPDFQAQYQSLLLDDWLEQRRVELSLINPAGFLKPCLLSATRLRSKVSSSLSIILSDLSALKETEQLLRQNNDQLREANEALNTSNDSLQQFAYVASHDLQEPLRKIQQFGELLRTNFGAGLGPDGADMVHRMGMAASRMSLLISDLLNYSRLTTQQGQLVPVALNQLVDEVLDTLSLAVSECRAEVRVGELPTVLGDQAQLKQLFQNLLSNALKFRRANVPPLIQVRSRQVLAANMPPSVKATLSGQPGSGQVFNEISLIDNGIGFEPIYLDRIFQVFQRLHGKNQYPGSGVGLAICRKVAYNHRGALTAQSQPGSGATFLLYLPD